MALVNIDALGAAKVLADETAEKLDPILQRALVHFVAELKNLLVGRTITIKID